MASWLSIPSSPQYFRSGTKNSRACQPVTVRAAKIGEHIEQRRATLMIDSKHGKDTTRIQRRTVACELRELADKIDQGGRVSVWDDLPLPTSIPLKKTDVPPSIPLEKTDDQIEARTGELISRHLREIAR